MPIAPLPIARRIWYLPSCLGTSLKGLVVPTTMPGEPRIRDGCRRSCAAPAGSIDVDPGRGAAPCQRSLARRGSLVGGDGRRRCYPRVARPRAEVSRDIVDAHGDAQARGGHGDVARPDKGVRFQLALLRPPRMARGRFVSLAWLSRTGHVPAGFLLEQSGSASPTRGFYKLRASC